jgi:hypothetical protein
MAKKKIGGWNLNQAVFFIVALTIVLICFYFYDNDSRSACTLEAKQCPDGSYVGRIGPVCDFSACPEMPVVGGDRDEHGCIGSAGYSWCEPKQKCLRVWEESCMANDGIDQKNGTYTIDGREITLQNGRSEVETAPGSSSKITTEYFGNEADGDLNGDGINDKAFILTQNTGGTGTFYYLAAFVSEGAGYRGTNTIFLGDRIAPQTTEVAKGMIAANYAERKPDEPMTARPSMGVSKYAVFENGSLKEVFGDFHG